METNNNIDRLLEMLDYPERYCEQEILDAVNCDDETREFYRRLTQVARARHDGKVIARVTYVGYKTAYRLCSRDNIGTIKMQPDSRRLNSVVVAVSAPRLKQEPGKFIYRPSPAELAGIDSYDLQRYAPLVTFSTSRQD